MRTEPNAYSDDFPPVARDGWIYIAAGAFATVLFLGLGWYDPAAALLLGTLFVVWFFRDPRRSSPREEGALLSPADGTILGVEPVAADPDIGAGRVVSIFMSVFNVHVNRCPLDGTVRDVRYQRGRFLSAYKKEAPEENERNEVVIEGKRGRVKFVQIAGLIARRIVCRLKPGDPTLAGERFGLIKFGSRVDAFIPGGYRLAVGPGDKVRAGLTVLARWEEGAS